MGDNEPESQSLSLQVRETAWWSRELSASCKEGSLVPREKQGRWSAQSSRAEPLVADAKGDQRGMGQHSGVWSSAVSAVVWSLPHLYHESGAFHPSGSFNKCLGTPDGKCGISPGAYLWVVLLWQGATSGKELRYPHIWPENSCVCSDLVSLLNWSVMADWQPFWLTWVTLLCFIYFMLP